MVTLTIIKGSYLGPTPILVLGVFKGAFLDENCHRIQVIGIGLAAQTKGLQGNGPTASKGIEDLWGFAPVGRQDILSGPLDHGLVEGVFPFGEFSDELPFPVPVLDVFRSGNQRGIVGGPGGSE